MTSWIETLYTILRPIYCPKDIQLGKYLMIHCSTIFRIQISSATSNRSASKFWRRVHSLSKKVQFAVSSTRISSIYLQHPMMSSSTSYSKNRQLGLCFELEHYITSVLIPLYLQTMKGPQNFHIRVSSSQKISHFHFDPEDLRGRLFFSWTNKKN